MKNYNLRINGKVFSVTVEDIPHSSGGRSAAPAAAPAPIAKPAAAPAALMAASGTAVTSPMAGTVSTIIVKAGDVVKQGDLLFTIVDSNTDSEILAPAGGTLSKICVSAGAAVNTGDSLAIF